MPIDAVLAYGGGVALGGLFFGGLYLTVNRLANLRRPALWAVVSFTARAGLVVLGVGLLSGGSPLPAVSCLLGFMTVRLLAGTAAAHTEQP